MKRCKGLFFLLPAVCLFCGFHTVSLSELSSSTEVLLKKLVQTDIGSGVKEQKVEITAEGFLRLRRKLQSGKEEYFSFHFSRYQEMDYTGTTENGYANILVADTNVIVQTFHDPAGNIDSMATHLKIGFQQCSAEELSQLASQFTQLRKEMGSRR